MVEQWLARRRKIVRGMLRTYVAGRRTAAGDRYWDEVVWSGGVSDRQSLNADRDELSARYNYATIETLILRHLHNVGFSVAEAEVADIGSGGGHWINFYRSLGATRVVGSDVSENVVKHLTGEHEGDPAVEIVRAGADSVLDGRTVDLVNAVGVMFHVVDDGRWRAAIRSIGAGLRPGGMLVVGGNFGWLPRVNVQFNDDGAVNKRLRPAREWRRELRCAGFDDVRIYRNPGYLFLRSTQPENHLLVATRAVN